MRPTVARAGGLPRWAPCRTPSSPTHASSTASATSATSATCSCATAASWRSAARCARPAPRSSTAAGRCSCRASPTRTSTRCRAASSGSRCDLSGLPVDRAAYLAHVASYAASRPDLDWVQGGGWAMAAFPGGLPTAAELDTVVADRPAVAGQPRPPRHVGQQPRARGSPASPATPPTRPTAASSATPTGEPTGMLHEGAMGLVLAVLPTATADELHAGLLDGQRHLLSLGITGWQDAIVGAYAGMQDTGPTYLRAAALGRPGRLGGRGAVVGARARAGAGRRAGGEAGGVLPRPVRRDLGQDHAGRRRRERHRGPRRALPRPVRARDDQHRPLLRRPGGAARHRRRPRRGRLPGARPRPRRPRRPRGARRA